MLSFVFLQMAGQMCDVNPPTHLSVPRTFGPVKICVEVKQVYCTSDEDF